MSKTTSEQVFDKSEEISKTKEKEAEIFKQGYETEVSTQNEDSLKNSIGKIKEIEVGH